MSKVSLFSLMALVILAAACAPHTATLAAQVIEPPQFSVMPDPIDRGTAGLVVVTGPPEAAPFRGEFDGRPILFSPAGEGRWGGYFGADVMLTPGRYPLAVYGPGGRTEVEVTVRDRNYGRRSITVPQSQVDLSAEDQARAAREKALVDQALGTITPERLWQSPFVDPVSGQVNSSFGRQTVMNGVLNPRPHAGADFSVPEGTAVKAPSEGRVILTGFHFFAGGSVYIDHGQGLISMYFHLSEIKVKEGDLVKRGDLLGLSGKTGRVTGAHLHYGTYLCGARIDPVAFHKLTTQTFKE